MTDEAIFEGQRWLWSIGDYPAVARRLAPISEATVTAAGIGRGDRVLDVAVGDGNAAILAARQGATVTGIDLTPSQLEKARVRCSAEGVEVDLREANAEDLPFDDSSFDVVTSVMGVIFAPDHARAAAEMARVCRPGGTVAITSWAEEGWFSTWRRHAGALMPAPAPGGPDPDAWGDPAELERRLSAAGIGAKVTIEHFDWTFPTIEDGIEFFTSTSGPFIAFLQMAARAGKEEEAMASLREAFEEAGQAPDGSYVLSAPYLLAVGNR